MKKAAIIILFGFTSTSFSLFQNTFFPDHFPKVKYNLKANPLDPSIISIGRALFYDPILSADNSTSCASCHSPFNAFAHTDHDLSHGIHDSIGTRNAPALFNLAWQPLFMHDGAVNHLDVQALAPIEHPGEMAESFANVIGKIQKSEIYKPLFETAFNDTIIDGERFLKSISQFLLTLVSADSKFDRVQSGSESFNNVELKGYHIFKKKCNSCHSEPLFSSFDFSNNGLPIDSTLMDFGRMGITQDPLDKMKFKIPSLRNLDYTFPYMHDGRFDNLNEILDHYESGIVESKTLDPRVKGGIKLSTKQRVELKAFLATLNDKEFSNNPEHQFPRHILLTNN